MSKQEQELAVIDFSQFSVAQLPELKGKKEEIASVIEANPIVEIVDNPTYESAKKSRTAVKTLRTSLEREQKDVKKKIKEHVLDVVDKEYDTLVLGVKTAEQSRQEPIDVWEEKKEQERQEKALAEQRRIDEIETKISDYVASWKEAFSFMFLHSIKEVSESFYESNNTFDKTALQEFDVLFEREVLTLAELLDSKISTLQEQEQIRIDQENLKIQNAIADWFRNWNNKIIFSTDSNNCKELFKDFNSESGMNCKQFQKEYAERRSDLVSLFDARIKMLIDSEDAKAEQGKIAEEQRIAQEKLDQEKKEFQEKQAEAKFKERKNILFDEGYWEIFFIAEANENDEIAKSKLVAYSEDDFDKFVDAVKKARTPIEAIEVVLEEVIESERLFDSEPIVSESTINIGSRIVRGDYKEPEIQEVEFEETWDSIREDFKNTKLFSHEDSGVDVLEFFCQYLEKNYNVPTKKQ